jgi:hypothetical protein
LLWLFWFLLLNFFLWFLLHLHVFRREISGMMEGEWKLLLKVEVAYARALIGHYLVIWLRNWVVW